MFKDYFSIKRPNLNIDLSPVRVFISNYRNLVGVCCFSLVFLIGFFMFGHAGLYFNLSGFLIVVGGTCAVAFISFKFERLKILYLVLKRSYRSREIAPEEIVETLVDLSLKSKLRGLLSLQEDEQEATVMFLRHALGYLVDGYDTRQIRDFLTTETRFFQMRREETERVLRTLAEICPSFGLIGSVVGLMSMLAGVGDSSVILATIPVALTSTLYGVLFANFLFLPLAAHIQERTDREVLLQHIITEGVIAIAGNLHPRALENKLKSFLTPSARADKLVSLERIQQKFNVRPAAKK
ncbi:MAG: MotA/TolQ/ExbB proton channel family protein [Thermodesulfobacteriota bacterium]|nr:MotA/TolQ/ExbB proton channel family protein [Thermodesulfobacteriota bacterium]